MAEPAEREMPELRVTPDRYLPVRYAGASGDFNPIHVDPEFARSVGLPDAILHGLYMMGLAARAAGQAEPAQWAQSAWQSLEAQGQRLIKDGKRLDEPADNVQELGRLAGDFAQRQLPVLQSLQVTGD